MNSKNLTTLEELFAELIDNYDLASYGLSSQQVVQLKGQVEESWGLLSDVVDELRAISPAAVDTIKSLTLQIFECDSDSESG